MNGKDRVVVVERTGEHRGKGTLFGFAFQFGDLGFEFGAQGFVVEFGKFGQVTRLTVEESHASTSARKPETIFIVRWADVESFQKSGSPISFSSCAS